VCFLVVCFPRAVASLAYFQAFPAVYYSNSSGHYDSKPEPPPTPLTGKRKTAKPKGMVLEKSLMGLTAEQAKEFDNWVENNSMPEGERNATLDDFVKHVQEEYGVKVSDAPLTPSLVTSSSF